MTDLSRVKSNVAKMASQNAPEEDIDGYIQSEGTTVDEIRAFRPQTGPQGESGVERVARAVIPAYGGYKAIEKPVSRAYSAVREPLEAFAQKTALLPALLRLAPKIKQPNPVGMFLPPGLGEMIPPLEATGEERSRQVAGLGVDTMLGLGAERIAAKAVPKMLEIGGAVSNTARKVPNFVRNIGRSIEQTRKPPIPFEVRVGRRAEQIKSTGSAGVESIKSKLKTDLDLIDEQFQKAAEFESRRAQSDLSNAFKKGKKNYEIRLDKSADLIDRSNKPFTKHELSDAIDETMEEVRELFIDEGGAPIKTIEKIREKYFPKYTKTGAGELQPVIEPVKLKDVLIAKRAVSGSVSQGVKTGSKSFTPDDIVAAIFNKNIGKRISQKDSSFGALQGDYGKMAERMKDAYRLFKIGKGSKFTKTGTEAIKRVAKGTAEAGEVQAVKGLVKGDRLAPGIRDIAESPKKILLEGQRREALATQAIGKQTKSTEQSIGRLSEREFQRNRLLKQKQGRQKIAKVAAAGTAVVGLPEVGRRIFRLLRGGE